MPEVMGVREDANLLCELAHAVGRAGAEFRQRAKDRGEFAGRRYAAGRMRQVRRAVIAITFGSLENPPRNSQEFPLPLLLARSS